MKKLNLIFAMPIPLQSVVETDTKITVFHDEKVIKALDELLTVSTLLVFES